MTTIGIGCRRARPQMVARRQKLHNCRLGTQVITGTPWSWSNVPGTAISTRGAHAILSHAAPGNRGLLTAAPRGRGVQRTCMDQITRLIARWKAHGIDCLAGVPRAEVEAFEALRNVILPPDMRAYFLAVNGMGQLGMCDEDLFSFWPLQQLITIAEDLPDRSARFPESSHYFMFADHSISLPTFAIRLSANLAEPNPVASVFSDFGAFEVENFFDSFTDFLNHYLDDPLKTSTIFPRNA